MRQNLDAVVCLSGEEGSGKSHLGLRMGNLLSKEFSCERNVLAFPTYEKIKEKMVKLPKYTPIILDEAIKTMYKRNFASRSNILLNQMFNLCRKLNLIYLICVPRFSDLDPYFREHRVLLNLVIPSVQDTGVAVVHRRDDNPYNPAERWHLKEAFEKTKARATAGNKVLRFDMLSRAERLNAMENTPNYMMTIQYGFDKELDREYLKFLKDHADEFNDDETDGFSSREKVLQTNLELAVSELAKRGVSRTELGDLFKLSPNTISKYLKKQGLTFTALKTIEAGKKLISEARKVDEVKEVLPKPPLKPVFVDDSVREKVLKAEELFK